jgi:epoxyqueuosine reductase
LIREAASEPGTVTLYRPPLVGFASAEDPAWRKLRELADPEHLLPEDLLPGARSVLAFFLPFDESVIRANRRSAGVAPEWALAYRETNSLLAGTTARLLEALRARGIRAAAEPPTHNFDRRTLHCRWSHKSAAAVAGLGSFGLHRLLITDAGCAGRFGSVVLDAELEPTTSAPLERCLHFAGGTCRACVTACPVGALRLASPGEENLDRKACYARLLEVEATLEADCCGKCSLGPCALGPATAVFPE